MKKIALMILSLSLVGFFILIVNVKADSNIVNFGNCDPSVASCNTVGNIGNTGNTISGAGANSKGSLPNPLGVNTIQDIIPKVLSSLIDIAVPIGAIAIIYGAFQMLTAGGDPEKFTKGRKTITYAAIGVAVIILANAIIAVVKSVLGA